MNILHRLTPLHGLLALCCLLSLTPARAAPPEMTGHWQLVPDASTDPRKALKGLGVLRRQQHAFTEDPASNSRDPTTARYYAQQELLDAQRNAREMSKVGRVEDLLGGSDLQVSAQDKSLTMNFDGKLERHLTPTDGEPVYSAKGNEYSMDALGQTLSYRKDGALMVETLMEPRGRLHEEYRVDPATRQLRLKIFIENPDWIVPVHMHRVFQQVP